MEQIEVNVEDLREATDAIRKHDEALRDIKQEITNVRDQLEGVVQVQEDFVEDVREVGEVQRSMVKAQGSLEEEFEKTKTFSEEELRPLVKRLKTYIKKFRSATDEIEEAAWPEIGRVSTKNIGNGRVSWAVGVLAVFVIGLQVLTLRAVGVESSQVSEDRNSSSLEKVTELYEADVQVLDGVGKNGLATAARSFLEENNITVTAVGEASVGIFPKTTVFVHQDASEVAKEVASRLGLPGGRVRPGLTSESGIDMTVVIGQDYQSLTPYTSTEPQTRPSTPPPPGGN